MGYLKRGIQSRIPRTKVIITALFEGALYLRLIHVSMLAQCGLPSRRNATLVFKMRCNDRNHLRFSYDGIFLDAIYSR